MIDKDEMLKKIKIRLGIKTEETEHDEVLRLMLDDAVMVISIFCNRDVFPIQLEDVITTKQIKQKLFDEWGERSTLFHSSDKLIATLKAMDVLESENVGVYSIKKHTLAKPEIVNFLLYSMMKIDDAGYYSLFNMENSKYLFPFEYKVNKESVMEDDRFIMGTFGGEISFSLKG